MGMFLSKGRINMLFQVKIRSIRKPGVLPAFHSRAAKQFFPLIISTKYKFSLRFFSFNYRIFVFIFHSPSLLALFLLLTQPHCPIA